MKLKKREERRLVEKNKIQSGHKENFSNQSRRLSAAFQQHINGSKKRKIY